MTGFLEVEDVAVRHSAQAVLHGLSCWLNALVAIGVLSPLQARSLLDWRGILVIFAGIERLLRTDAVARVGACR